jgi:hypothetical protein
MNSSDDQPLKLSENILDDDIDFEYSILKDYLYISTLKQFFKADYEKMHPRHFCICYMQQI